MKTTSPLVILVATTMAIGCVDKKAAEEKARQDAEAKVRADATKKEMETLPQAFRPRYYGKRLVPETPPATTATTTTTTTATEPPKKP